MNEALRLPSDQQRHVVVGATGSGKTQNAVWHLSHRNFHLYPWIVYNYKGDESIDGIPFIQEIPLDVLPKLPGVYAVHPLPEEDDDAVEDQLRAIWERGGIGVYIDEGYMIARDSRAFRALLTQGRSKRIPMMILSQRPVWLDRFAFSESEFYQVFRLQHEDDRRTMGKIVPADFERTLPEYHSYYYDAPGNRLMVMRPVPKLPVIYATFRARLGRLLDQQRRMLKVV